MRRRRGRLLTELSAEMLRRRVYPVIIAYALICWSLLQIGEVTFEPLGFPGWLMTILVVMAIAGFPIAAILAWMFDITPSGIRRDSQTTIRDSPSVAVLPFSDMSENQDQDYFCEGVAEAILNSLTQIKSLRVAARMSSFQYGSSAADVRDIGRQLGVDMVLEGSIRKCGNRLRITAQLVNVESGYHMWSRQFDRELEDVFEIQDEIASNIAALLPRTGRPGASSPTRDAVAYDYYLRGRKFLDRFSKSNFEFARQMFRQAVERDPDFALAWASYANCFSLEVMYADPDPRFKDKAREASERALALQPDLAQAHVAAGLCSLVSKDFERAGRELSRAIEIDPALSEAYYYFARVRFHEGDLEESARLFEKAMSINPEDYQSRLLRVQILRGTGRPDQAVREAREAIGVVERRLELHPDDVRALHMGASSLIVLGETDRATQWIQRGLEIDPNDPISLYNAACSYATLDKVEESIGYLERAVENGTISEDWMQHDPDLDSVRTHPKFDLILARAEA